MHVYLFFFGAEEAKLASPGVGLRHFPQRQVWQRCERACRVEQAGACPS
jgi:hypothetical protein